MNDDRQWEDDDEPFDPDRRELCSDGMCIGVIGKDGRCKVCGRPASSATAAKGPPPAAKVASSGWRPRAVPDEDEEEAPEQEEDVVARGQRPDFERTRVPCSDDMCTGIIGRSGRCGTCGKPWAGPDS